MNIKEKTMIICSAVAVLISMLISIQTGGTKANILTNLGAYGFLIGFIELIVGLFLLFLKDKSYAQGFMIAGGIIMLIGFTTCAANFNMGQ